MTNEATVEQNNLDQASAAPKAIPESEKRLTFILYILHSAGIFTGITPIIGIIINYIKRSEITDPVIKSHFSYQIRTFWWALGLSVVSWILMFVIIGIFMAIGVLIWFIYRMVKGLIRLNDGKEI